MRHRVGPRPKRPKPSEIQRPCESTSKYSDRLLGTLFHGVPLVSLVLFSAADDGSAIDIHVSRLAQHTQGLLESGRVGLMIAEPDRDSRNP